jgi:plasmid maintenance system antidote protein VapI
MNELGAGIPCAEPQRVGRSKVSTTNRITEILRGRRATTADTALRLAHFFGTTAEFWLNPQSFYEIRLAQQKANRLGLCPRRSVSAKFV